jgi:hypothetical protein
MIRSVDPPRQYPPVDQLPPLRFATWNLKSAIPDNVKFTVATYMRRENICLVFVTEHKLRGITLNADWGQGVRFVGIGSEQSTTNSGGVGFAYQHARISLEETSLRLISNRLCHAKFIPGPGGSAPFIGLCAYAPTESHTPRTKESFYLELDRVYTELKASVRDTPYVYIYTAGDMNTHFGTDAASHDCADYLPFDAGRHSSTNGQYLLDFCDHHQLKVANLSFKNLPDCKLHTWHHPRTNEGQVKDLLLVSRNCRKQLKIVQALRPHAIFDHKALSWTLNPKNSRFKPSTAKPRKPRKPRQPSSDTGTPKPGKP